MKSNLLHINLDKCYNIMHFCPKIVNTKNDNFVTEDHESSGLHDLDNTLNISGTSIPEVNSIEFLGVTINNQLSWIPHINNMHKKLKSATGHSCQTALFLGGRPPMPFFCPAFWTLPWEALLLPSFGTHLPFLLGFLEIYQSYTISDRDFSKICLKKRSPLL